MSAFYKGHSWLPVTLKLGATEPNLPYFSCGQLITRLSAIKIKGLNLDIVGRIVVEVDSLCVIGFVFFSEDADALLYIA